MRTEGSSDTQPPSAGYPIRHAAQGSIDSIDELNLDWLRTFADGYVEGLGSACKPVDGHGRWE